MWWINQKLYTKIFICIIIGIILGVILGPKAAVIEPIGDIFIRLLKMLIVPLTLFTIISGITKMEDLKSLRSVGGRIIIYYIITSLIAVTIGVAVGVIVKPGKDAVGILESDIKVEESEEFSFIENLVGWFPENPVEAMASANMLQIIIFSLFIGIGLLILGDEVKGLVNIIDQCSDVMIRVTEIIMRFAPYGILALIANMVGTLGTEMLAEVGKFILADYIGVAIMLLIVYPLILKGTAKIKPGRFYRCISPAMLVAASTTSSAATLPVSMNIAENQIEIPENIYGFSLPLGSTINMDGMSIALGIIPVFACFLYDKPITFTFILQFIFLGLMLSIGTAGVKGAGIVMSTVLLQTLNMPLTLVPILAAIWPIIDIGHTTTNITGDLVGATIVAAKVGAIDAEEFNKKEVNKTEA